MRAARKFQIPLVVAVALTALAAACADEAVAPADDVTPPSETANVYVVVSEDVILNGRLFGGDNEVLVILSHMRPNDQTAWFDFARELADEGYAALTFNFRGYGESGGDQDFDQLDEDLAAVIGYMRDRGVQQIFLVGASMGATTSLVVAAQEPVEGVVALSPPAQFESQDALAAVGSVGAPKLFIASEGDAPALRFDELLAAAAQPKEDELYPGSAHGTDLLLPAKNEQAGAVRERILQFLQEQAGS